MEPFSIQTKLTPADWEALQRVCALRLRQRTAFASKWAGVALWIAIAVVSAVVTHALKLGIDGMSMALGVILCVVLVIVVQKRAARLTEPREGGAFLSPTEYEFSPAGVTWTKPGARSFVEWRRVADMTATSEHIFIWLDTFAANVIPVRDLPAGATAEQALATFEGWKFASTGTHDLPLTPVPATESESSWRAVFRLLTLRHLGNPDSVLSGKALPIVMLALASLVLWVGLSWFFYLPDPEFFPYGAPTLASYVIALQVVAVILAKGSRPEVPLARVASLLAILLPVLIVAEFAIGMWVPEQWTDVAHWILGLYAIVYCTRGLQALTGLRQPTAVLGAFAVAVMFFWAAGTLYLYPAVWTTGEDGEEYAEGLQTGNAAADTLLFEQPALIDASVARIDRATGDAPVGFFVGFAGYGGQQVFAEEIKFAAQTVAERFDTADRTLLLINDRRDLQAQPLATVAGLRYALKAVASKMRVDRDVLFLALSSHGSEDPLLSVENGTLPLRDLTGDALAEALQASGIKWKVIVISACHAGAFIESLQDPYTIVITAASPDRTSFGCSDDRDLTYFGEAFFRDSLPQATSLRDAFDTAAKLVRERETQEGFEASKPQAFFGENIEPRLASMLRAASSP